MLFTIAVIPLKLSAFSVCLNSTRPWPQIMTRVADAVILAGGKGTRMLPASLYMPKEIMPLVDTPILHHLIWEAVRAGAQRIHLVLSERKSELLRSALGSTEPLFGQDVRPELPRSALTPYIEGVETMVHIQHRPGGVGDAISTALGGIKGPFLVILGDNLLIKEHIGPSNSGPDSASSASLELVERFEKTGVPSVGVLEVPEEEVHKYGVLSFNGDMVESIVEKPVPSESPSRYVLCGRYLLPENTSEVLDLFPENEHGEMQSIALLRHLINFGGLEAVKLDGYEMYDSGDPLSWLKSQVDHAIRREDIGEEISIWLRTMIGKGRNPPE